MTGHADRLKAVEDRHLKEMAEPCLGMIERADLTTIREILLQRRRLSMYFTLLCDEMICALDSDDARGVVIEIVRDEYSHSHHREDFVQELFLLGLDRSLVVNHSISPETRQAIERTRSEIERLTRASDLERLSFLRFFGEVTPGVEFQALHDRLTGLSAIPPGQSRFLGPHVEYDKAGAMGGPSHADRYLPQLLKQVRSEQCWSEIERNLETAKQIRIQFYSQFDEVEKLEGSATDD